MKRNPITIALTTDGRYSAVNMIGAFENNMYIDPIPILIKKLKSPSMKISLPENKTSMRLIVVIAIVDLIFLGVLFMLR